MAACDPLSRQTVKRLVAVARQHLGYGDPVDRNTEGLRYPDAQLALRRELVRLHMFDQQQLLLHRERARAAATANRLGLSVSCARHGTSSSGRRSMPELASNIDIPSEGAAKRQTMFRTMRERLQPWGEGDTSRTGRILSEGDRATNRRRQASGRGSPSNPARSKASRRVRSVLGTIVGSRALPMANCAKGSWLGVVPRSRTDRRSNLAGRELLLTLRTALCNMMFVEGDKPFPVRATAPC